MNRLILDHLRRWGWLWLLIGIVNGFMTGAAVGDKHQVFNAMSFPLLLWLGTMQLNMDLGRGICRVQTTLPVTVKQIGQAWWIFSVGLPALLLLVTSAIALLIHSGHTGNPFPIKYFLVNVTTSGIFLGAMFSLFVDELPGLPQSGFEWLRRIFSIAIMCGMVFTLVKPDNLPTIPLLVLAAIMTAASWFRAEQMVVRRATFKPGVPRGKSLPGKHQAPAGFGGLPYLIQTLAWQIGRLALVVVAWFLIMHLMMGGHFNMSPKKFMSAAMPAFSTFGFFALFMFLAMPMMMQLRHLRTLPISTTALTSIMVLPSTLVVLGIGAIWAAINGNILQIPVGVFAYAAAMSLTGPLLIGQGMRNGAYIATMALVMFTESIFIFMPLDKVPAHFLIIASLAVILISFEITRRLLKSSSKAYRTPAANMVGWGYWGAVR